MGHEQVEGVAIPGYYAGSHDEDDLYDLCQEVGVLEVVRCADYQENECHYLIEAGVIDCRRRKPTCHNNIDIFLLTIISIPNVLPLWHGDAENYSRDGNSHQLKS